jgi:hypothetical protein
LVQVASRNFGPATGYLQQARGCYAKRDDILRVVIEQSDAFIKDNKPRRAVELIRSVLRIVPDSPASALLKQLEEKAQVTPTPAATP